MANAVERRCKAQTKRGERCAGRIVNADGLCPMHAGTTDPRQLGKASGKARRGPKPERVHESLRSYLKREVAPSEVWTALQQAMTGANESARVSASTLLLDTLYEPAGEKKNQRADAGQAGQKLEAAFARIVAAQPAEERPEFLAAERERLLAEVTELKDELSRLQELVA